MDPQIKISNTIVVPNKYARAVLNKHQKKEHA